MPLLLNNREVAAALQAGEYVDAMAEAFRELGAGRAVNSLRVDACVPLDSYTPALKQSTEAHIAALDDRTEGWIAGLQMAALALSGHSNTEQFIRDFTGSHRFVLDYLAERQFRVVDTLR